jgi:Mrp family chromosome partitioning ATPase/capsular polysaccharide biosynthesis protein
VSEAQTEQKDFRTYLRPVLKRWWLIALVVPIATYATYRHYDSKPSTFQSFSELYGRPSTLEQLIFGQKAEGASKVEDDALLIETSTVANRAEELLSGERQPAPEEGTAKHGKGKGSAKNGKNAESTGEVEGEPTVPLGEGGIPNGGIEAGAIEKSNFIVITGSSDTANGAARLANAYAQAFVELQRSALHREAASALQTARSRLAAIRATPAEEKEEEGSTTARRREALERQIEQLQLVASQSASGGVRQVELAQPEPPIESDPKGNAIFAFLVSLMLAIGACYGLEYLNRRIGTVEDVEEVYDLPILTEIPRVSSPAPLTDDGVAMARPLAGPFQRLQTTLDVQARERPIRTILVASAVPEEGKSIVARNLAVAYREAGRTVAVLDADFHNASLRGLLAADEGPGLADVLAGRASFGQVVQEVAVKIGTNGNSHAGHNGFDQAAALTEPAGELAMVPAGAHHGRLAGVFGSDAMHQTLLTAADTYGLAIIDSPPLLAVADALPLLSEVDAVVLVTRLGVSTRDAAKRLLSELRRVPDAQIAGVVVNGIPPRTYRSRSYGYEYD